MSRYSIVSALAASVLLMSLASCVKDRLYHTLHPDTGAVTVNTDWSGIGEDRDIPSEWFVLVGEKLYKAKEPDQFIDSLFVPGKYTVAVYNIPENIAVDGTVASLSVAADGSACPGWLFAFSQDVDIKADTDHEITAVMGQQVRELDLIIELTGENASLAERFDCSLAGAAGKLDFHTGEHSSPVSISIPFSKITEGENAGKWRGSVRLLGVAGESQKLVGTVEFSDGTLSPMLFESDLTEYLADFNNVKSEPCVLGGVIVQAPLEAGVTGTVNGWTQVDGGDIDAQ